MTIDNARVLTSYEYDDTAPDWTELFTAFEAEYQLTNFKFNGPGWYLETNDDTILVMKTDIFRDGNNDQPVFRFVVFNGRDPRNAIKALANAPVTKDNSVQFKYDLC